MTFDNFCDQLLPQQIVEGAKETHRRATLIVYATAFAFLTPIPVAMILFGINEVDLAWAVLLGALPSAATLLVLRMSHSTVLAGHYLTGWVFLQPCWTLGTITGLACWPSLLFPYWPAR